MEMLMDGIRWIHIGFGFVGLAAFWVPVVTHKGGKNHRFYGKIFKWCDVNKAYIFMKLGSKKEFNRLNSYI